jgi:hypothetical protein
LTNCGLAFSGGYFLLRKPMNWRAKRDRSRLVSLTICQALASGALDGKVCTFPVVLAFIAHHHPLVIPRPGKSLRLIRSYVKPLGEKYSASVFPKNMIVSALSRLRSEGRFAIVTNVGSGMRWT